MLKLRTILTLLFSLSVTLGFAQGLSKSAVHLEAFGAGWYTNVKFIRAFRYEYFLVEKEKHALMLQAGLGVSKWTDFTTEVNPDILIPLSLGYMYGKSRSRPIVSAGMIYSSYTFFNARQVDIDRHRQLSLSWSAGYRYAHPNGITCSIFYIGMADGLDVIRYGAGFSIGYRFKKGQL